MGYAALMLLAGGIILAVLAIVFWNKHRRAMMALAFVAALCAGGGAWLSSEIYRRMTFNLQSVKLPPGYRMKHWQGDDSYTGTIERPGGLQIVIDIGMGAGALDPSQTEGYEWFEERQVGGHRVYVALGKPDGTGQKFLAVTFENRMNFFAAVNSKEEMDEMLTIVFTYEPIKAW